MIAEALLETKKVTKTYGGIPAIDAVDFDLQQPFGQCHPASSSDRHRLWFGHRPGGKAVA